MNTNEQTQKIDEQIRVFFLDFKIELIVNETYFYMNLICGNVNYDMVSLVLDLEEEAKWTLNISLY